LYGIDDLAGLFKVKRVYSFVVNILLKGIEIDHLATVATVMEKQAVVRTSIVDEPMHRTQYVGAGRHPHLIIRIGILENDHIVRLKSKTRNELGDAHDVVNASAQRMFGADVIDSDQEGLQLEGNIENSLPFVVRCTGNIDIGIGFQVRDGSS
jgi:hypothetical protein